MPTAPIVMNPDDGWACLELSELRDLIRHAHMRNTQPAPFTHSRAGPGRGDERADGLWHVEPGGCRSPHPRRRSSNFGHCVYELPVWLVDEPANDHVTKYSCCQPSPSRLANGEVPGH